MARRTAHPQRSLGLNVLDDTQSSIIVDFFAARSTCARARLHHFEIEHSAEESIFTQALGPGTSIAGCSLNPMDHDLFIGCVVGGRLLGDGRPMVHVRKTGSHY